MYERVLHPTDGSDGTDAVTERAVGLAAAVGATVHAVYVVDERGAAGGWDLAVERREAEGEAALDAVAAAGDAADVPVVRHLRRGVPYEELLAAVDDYGCDVVVMGTHGREGLDRVVHAGSVTERVVRHAAVPVVAVPLGGGPE